MNKPISSVFRQLCALMRPTSCRIAGLALALSPGVSLAKEIKVFCQNNAGDAALINSAIAGSVSGDEILIQGPALLTQTIRLVHSRSYRGTSRTGTVLKQANGVNLVALMASDSFLDNSTTTGNPLAVRHLTLDGNKANNTAATVGLIIRSWESVVEDIEVKQMDGDGIRITSVSANGTVQTNTQVNGRIAGCLVNDCSGRGISVKDGTNSCTDWTMFNNTVRNSGETGIYLENSAGWFVVQNKVYNSSRSGIYADRCFGTSITENYVEDFGRSSTTGTYQGVGVTLQGGVGTAIAGNVVKNLTAAGSAASAFQYIAIVRVNYDTGYASVTDNIATHSISTTGPSVGVFYSKGSAVGLTVASSANSATGVTTQKSVGSGVTQNSGL
ncbi:MAG: right-handed parallel beta-helix repeat-containing protein [Verrucomicrobiota bacterium]